MQIANLNQVKDDEVKEVSQRYFQLYGLYLQNYSAVQKVFSIIEQCIKNDTIQQHQESIKKTVTSLQSKCNEDNEITIEIFDQINEAFKDKNTAKQELIKLCKKYQQPKENIERNIKLMQMLFQTYFMTDRVQRPIFDLEILKQKLSSLQQLLSTAKKASECLLKNNDEFGSECAQFVEETVQQIINRVSQAINKQENKLQDIKQKIALVNADIEEKQKQLQNADRLEAKQLNFQIKQQQHNAKLLTKELEFYNKMMQSKKKQDKQK